MRREARRGLGISGVEGTARVDDMVAWLLGDNGRPMDPNCSGRPPG